MANLFDSASLVMIPSGYKAGKLYSIKPTDGTGDFTVARASTATRWNSDLELEEVAANVPRINYPSCPSVLLEPARTNLFLNSDVGATQTITVTNATEYTIYFLSGTGTIDLTGAFTATINVSDYTYNNSLTFTTTSTSLVCTVNGTANQVQVEAGNYPTSYIETTGATVNRAVDSLSLSGLQANDILGATEGTWFIDFNKVLIDTNSAIVIWITANAKNNSSIMFRSKSVGTNELDVRSYSDAGSVLWTSSTIDTVNAKVAIRWNGTAFSVFINGAQEDYVGQAYAYDDYDNDTTRLSILYSQMTMFPTSLTDAECIALTT